MFRQFNYPQDASQEKAAQLIGFIFGLPIVLNPILIIPFVLGPTVIVSINYFLFATGILPPVIVQPPFTVPIFFGGFIATGGSVLAGLVQLMNAAIAAIIYWPFFKKYDNQLKAQENADADTNANAEVAEN